MTYDRSHYVLDGHTPVREPDLLVWARRFEEQNRVVRQDELPGDVMVSTVFLGLNHQFGDGEPLLFETMVFGGPMDQEQDRYATWEEAEAGHVAMLARVKEAK